jgi:L-alanine-DL-glutamate epimerase-like enolase superfamily enzyme
MKPLLINEVAEKNNIPCMMGGMLESRVALTAKVHFAMAKIISNFMILIPAYLVILQDPVIGGVTYSGMHLQLSMRPVLVLMLMMLT